MSVIAKNHHFPYNFKKNPTILKSQFLFVGLCCIRIIMRPSNNAAMQKMLTASFAWAKDANGIFCDIFYGLLVLDNVCTVIY